MIPSLRISLHPTKHPFNKLYCGFRINSHYIVVNMYIVVHLSYRWRNTTAHHQSTTLTTNSPYFRRRVRKNEALPMHLLCPHFRWSIFVLYAVRSHVDVLSSRYIRFKFTIWSSNVNEKGKPPSFSATINRNSYGKYPVGHINTRELSSITYGIGFLFHLIDYCLCKSCSNCR